MSSSVGSPLFMPASFDPHRFSPLGLTLLLLLLLILLLFRHRMTLWLAPCSSSTPTLISVRIAMIQSSFKRRQNTPYITCATAGLTVFGGCTDSARGSKAFDFSVLYSILYSEYRVIFVLRALKYWWPKYSEYLEYEQY